MRFRVFSSSSSNIRSASVVFHLIFVLCSDLFTFCPSIPRKIALVSCHSLCLPRILIFFASHPIVCTRIFTPKSKRTNHEAAESNAETMKEKWTTINGKGKLSFSHRMRWYAFCHFHSYTSTEVARAKERTHNSNETRNTERINSGSYRCVFVSFSF